LRKLFKIDIVQTTMIAVAGPIQLRETFTRYFLLSKDGLRLRHFFSTHFFGYLTVSLPPAMVLPFTDFIAALASSTAKSTYAKYGFPEMPLYDGRGAIILLMA
jgi:hypothetical protein